MRQWENVLKEGSFHVFLSFSLSLLPFFLFLSLPCYSFYLLKQDDLPSSSHNTSIPCLLQQGSYYVLHNSHHHLQVGHEWCLLQPFMHLLVIMQWGCEIQNQGKKKANIFDRGEKINRKSPSLIEVGSNGSSHPHSPSKRLEILLARTKIPWSSTRKGAEGKHFTHQS